MLHVCRVSLRYDLDDVERVTTQMTPSLQTGKKSELLFIVPVPGHTTSRVHANLSGSACCPLRQGVGDSGVADIRCIFPWYIFSQHTCFFVKWSSSKSVNERGDSRAKNVPGAWGNVRRPPLQGIILPCPAPDVLSLLEIMVNIDVGDASVVSSGDMFGATSNQIPICTPRC